MSLHWNASNSFRYQQDDEYKTQARKDGGSCNAKSTLATRAEVQIIVIAFRIKDAIARIVGGVQLILSFVVCVCQCAQGYERKE